jgi:5-methylcytosine-specific restriction endonuclease McrA
LSKRCRGCSAEKPPAEFGVEKRNRDGRQARCVECNRARGREYAKKRYVEVRGDPEFRARKRESDRNSYAKHHAARRASAAEYARANAAKIAEYNKSELRKASFRKYRETHIERIREYDRVYRVVKRDELNAKCRERRARDNSTALANSHRRRARQMNAPGPGVTADQWVSILEQHGYRCAYCLEQSGDLTMDHVHSLATGGEHGPDNVVPACVICNSSKNHRSLLQLLNSPHLLVTQRMLSAG